MQTLWTRNYIYKCLSNFLLALVFYMLATILPLYVQAEHDGTQKEMGWVISLYILGSAMMRPISGMLLNFFPKKQIALIGLFLFVLLNFLYLGIKDTLIVLLICRFIHGASYALASTTINTLVVILTPQERRGEAIGYFSMFINLAMVLGPALSLFIWNQTNMDTFLFITAILSAIAFFLMKLIRLETEDFTTKPNKKDLLKSIIEIKALPLSLIVFLLYFSYSALASFLAAYNNTLGLQNITGLFFIIFGISIVCSRPLVSRLIDKIPSKLLFYPGIIFYSLSIVILSQATTGWMILLSSFIMGISYGILNPCLQYLVLKQAPTERSGSATSTFFLLADLGYGIGAYMLGMIAATFGYEVMFIFASCITVSGALIFLFFYQLRNTSFPKEKMSSKV